jgi:hypothetical protein
MNEALAALMTKLKWQINEGFQKLQDMETDLETLDQQRKNLAQNIQKTFCLPKNLLPEQEMARLSFTIRQQKQMDDLFARSSDLIQQKNRLQELNLRLKTELAMLEKHQEKKALAALKKNQVLQQNHLDEMVLLKGVKL